MTPADFSSPLIGAAALIAAASGSEAPSIDVRGIGWIGILSAVLAAIALYRAGSVRAWKETAEAREARIEDLSQELAELRAESSLPERIEGIVHTIGEMSVRQDAAAARRLEIAMTELGRYFARASEQHEARAGQILAAIAATNTKGE